jgi:hypothetical protein
MNHLVYLDTQAGELEKILSGTKSMVVKEFYPAQSAGQAVSPGDSLFFLRNNAECILRVKATVVGVLFLTNNTDEDLSHSLKELQPRLQLTEEQFNYWSAQKTVELVEFKCAQKIGIIQVALNKITNRADWVAFEELSQIM